VRERSREGKLRLTVPEVLASSHGDTLTTRRPSASGSVFRGRVSALFACAHSGGPPHDSARRNIGSVPWHPLIGDADRVHLERPESAQLRRPWPGSVMSASRRDLPSAVRNWPTAWRTQPTSHRRWPDRRRVWGRGCREQTCFLGTGRGGARQASGELEEKRAVEPMRDLIS
jgi:hypothetical protein